MIKDNELDKGERQMSKLDLTGKTVLHKTYGEGKVLSHEHLEDAEDTLRIVFSGVTKEFKYAGRKNR